jgi:transmembrane sensor
LKPVLFIMLPLLVAGSIYLWSRSNNSAPAGQEQNIELVAEMGSRKIALLPDGTKVWLNAGSRLHYDAAMNTKEMRSVTLAGEAFFDVAKNKEKPFIIHTGKVAIRVLGTAFNVRAYPGERLTEATLMRGSIELTVNSRPYQKIILKPNEKFALIEDAPVKQAPANIPPTVAGNNTQNAEKLIIQDIQPVHIADKEYVEEVSWTENEFVFQNETLDELAPKMERWFNVRININNPALKDVHFTGVFHKETIDEALAGMQMIQPFKYKITNNHVLIN